MKIQTQLLTLAIALSLPLLAKSDPNLADLTRISGVQSLSSSTVWSEALDRGIQRAIDPDDYICSRTSDFRLWIDNQLSQIDANTLWAMNALYLFDWTFDTKLLIDHDASDEYIGSSGEYTKRQNKTFKDNKRFWNIYSDDILLMGAHGAQILDDELVYAYMPLYLGPSPQFVQDIIVNGARSLIEGGLVDLTYFDPTAYFVSPGIPGGYDNPLLSLNGFAFTSYGEEIFPGSGIIPDKIVMGDGLLVALTEIGLGYKEAPDEVLGHEFAHHVQYEIGAFEPGPAAPEKTRRTELMADAFGAYFNSHARGNSFQAKRFADIMNAAYEVGDCGFASNGHHGTPLQREKAAIWGQLVAEDSANQGHIYSSETMLEMFDEALPVLVAPDAP